MATLQSSFVVGTPQADGRSYVIETHVDAAGVAHIYEYLSDGSPSPQSIMEERAATISAVLDEREAARLLVEGTEVAIDPYIFLARFTAQERVAVRTASETDPYVKDFMHLLDRAPGVRRSRAMPGLLYLQSLGCLTAERVEEIGDF